MLTTHVTLFQLCGDQDRTANAQMIKHGKPKEKREKLIPFYLVSRVLRLGLETRLTASNNAFLIVCAGYKISRFTQQSLTPIYPQSWNSYRSAPCELFFRLYHIATHYIKPTWRRSLDAGSLSQLSFLIPSLVTQTINCMSSCHLVTIVNPI